VPTLKGCVFQLRTHTYKLTRLQKSGGHGREVAISIGIGSEVFFVVVIIAGDVLLAFVRLGLRPFVGTLLSELSLAMARSEREPRGSCEDICVPDLWWVWKHVRSVELLQGRSHQQGKSFNMSS
jgi:hypothetical protein